MLLIESKFDDSKIIFKLCGVLDAATVDFFNTYFRDFQDFQDFEEKVFDMDKLSLIDSTGINGLARVIKGIQEKGNGVRVINVSEEFFEIFDLIGLTEVLGNIFEVK